MSDLNNIIDETIKALEDMKRSGVTHVDVSRETLEESGKPAVVSAVPSAKVGRVAETAAAGTIGSCRRTGGDRGTGESMREMRRIVAVPA